MRVFLIGFILACGLTFAEGVTPPSVAITNDAELQALVASEAVPVTAVIVTSCSLVVAVYVTMADGKLYRFSYGSSVSFGVAQAFAFGARNAERMEVSCAGVQPMGT